MKKRTSRASRAGAAPTLERTRPRAYEEWKALAAWGKLPAWERSPAGYLMRRAREEAGFTQSEPAVRLGISQQAVAQAERWASNPTVAFLRAWSAALDAALELGFKRRGAKAARPHSSKAPTA